MTFTSPIPIVQPDDYNQPSHPGDLLSRQQRLIYVFVLGALTALGPFTIDLYLPAFPALQVDLGVTETAIQLTLTGTVIGFAAGQLIVGPWSDRVGRRLPLIVSCLLHVAASVGAALSPDITWLTVFRLLVGFGAAAGGVVTMALVRDLFGGKPLVKMLSRLSLVNGSAPILAPLIGSQLLRITDWRGVFWVLSGYGLVVAIATVLMIVETLPKLDRQVATSSLASRFRVLFHDRIFIGAVVVGALNFTGLFAYLSTSSFLFQDVYHFTPQQYGLAFGMNSVGVVAGVQVSSWLMRTRAQPQWILAGTTVVQILAAVAIFVFDHTGAGYWGTAIPLWFLICACGFAFPAVQVLALAHHGAEAGTASSILGAANFGLAGIVGPILGTLGTTDASPMAGVMFLCACLATLSVWLVIRPRTVPPLSE